MKPYLCITGSHPDVLADIESMPAGYAWDYMAIGLDAVDKYIWPVLYVATYHPDEAGMIRERRRSFGGNLDYELISHEARPGVQRVVPQWWEPSGSSSLLGVQAALSMGYQKIILCGCPMTGKNAGGNDYDTFRSGWRARIVAVAPYVRSMSGWTAELLGRPTREWLDGGGL